MTEQIENLMLEHLKRFQAGQERMELKLNEVVMRIGRLEIGLADVRGELAEMGVRVDRMSERMDRIERRLELV